MLLSTWQELDQSVWISVLGLLLSFSVVNINFFISLRKSRIATRIASLLFGYQPLATSSSNASINF